MRVPRLSCILLLAAIAPASIALAAERTEIPDKYKWDRSHIFASDADWEAALEKAKARIPEIAEYEGRLGDSAGTLYDALTTMLGIQQDLSRVWTYASMGRDVDTRESRGTEMVQSVRQVWTDLGTASSFIQPELIQVGNDRIQKFIRKDDRLDEYRVWLDDVVRWAPYTRNPEVSRVMAQFGRTTNAGRAVHSTFTNAEFPYPEVTLSNGETVRLDASGYSRYRGTSNREDRMKVFEAFWTRYNEYRRTLAASLNAHVQTHVASKEILGFDSSLQASLFNNNIPTGVYRQLIEDVHDNLGSLHRYLKLKERMLGLDQIGYEDLYTSIVKEVDLEFTPEEAIELAVKSNELLGKDYVNVLADAFEQGWMDIMPSEGKRSGAYSTMVYGVHPYQLQNFNGGYDDVSTLAHEAGHSMHSFLSAKHQPYVTHDYSIFVAEVTSTLNENLLLYSMLGTASDLETELFLLGNALENFRTTMFRQTMFAEFELGIHEMAERGDPLTGDSLNEFYLGLVRKYYGHDEGVCNIDERYAVEWAYIPHFYSNFYVYQYATSLVAGTSLAKGIREDMDRGSTEKRDAYLTMLSSGSSKYPIDLLKDAGVDMTTSRPFAAATAEMNEIMDRMEILLDRAAGGGGKKMRE